MDFYLKNLLILFSLFYSFSVLAETYSCKYNEFGSTKIIIFDRVTHSHFKMCDNKNCDKNRFVVMYADEDNLMNSPAE